MDVCRSDYILELCLTKIDLLYIMKLSIEYSTWECSLVLHSDASLTKV